MYAIRSYYGALFAVAAGLVGWLGCELVLPDDSVWPPQLVGLLMAGLGMIVGSMPFDQPQAGDTRSS